MAWLEHHPTSGRFKICFRWSGQQFKKTVNTTDRSEAEAIMRRLEENIGLIERGRMEIPAGADLATFLLSDGKLSQPPKVVPAPKPLTLGELRDQYVQVHSLGTLEANSLQTLKMHLGHFVHTLGASFQVQNLKTEGLPAGIANHRAADYYGVSTHDVAHYVGQVGGASARRRRRD